MSFENTLTRCARIDDFPNIYFLVNGYWLQIPPHIYISDEGDYNGYCEMYIRKINAPFNVMGWRAYDGYYVTHDIE